MKLRRLICPLGAGVTSALGFLVAAPTVDLVRSHVTRLETADWALISSLFDEMKTAAIERLVEAGVKPDDITFSCRAEMRHVGQGFEITVPLPDLSRPTGVIEGVKTAFYAKYEELFGRRIDDVGIEAMTWRLHAGAPQSEVALSFAGQKSDSGARSKGDRRVYFPETGYAACRVYNRYALKSGETFRGPAVVEERESTTVIGPDSTITIDRFLNLVIDIDQPASAVADKRMAHANNS